MKKSMPRVFVADKGNYDVRSQDKNVEMCITPYAIFKPPPAPVARWSKCSRPFTGRGAPIEKTRNYI